MQIEYTKNGRRTNVHAKVAKVLISRGLARAVDDCLPPMYETRALQAAAVGAAPYGYKADGTPRKRPGRPVSAKEE